MFIHFNSKFKRFEVYGARSAVRNNEIQPVFVCDSRDKALAYVRRVKA